MRRSRAASRQGRWKIAEHDLSSSSAPSPRAWERDRPGKLRVFAALGYLAACLAHTSGCSEDVGESTPVADGAGGADEVLEATRKAEQAATRLLGALLTELSTALSSGPPEQAVDVCSKAAQHITEEVARNEGLSMRRVALRFRNPKNSPDSYERAVLETWAGSGDEPRHHVEVVALEDGGTELRYLRPIMLKPLCTACHGKPPEVNSKTREAIRERYPNDQATGFRPGELRGAVSVRIPLDA